MGLRYGITSCIFSIAIADCISLLFCFACCCNLTTSFILFLSCDNGASLLPTALLRQDVIFCLQQLLMKTPDSCPVCCRFVVPPNRCNIAGRKVNLLLPVSSPDYYQTATIFGKAILCTSFLISGTRARWHFTPYIIHQLSFHI